MTLVRRAGLLVLTSFLLAMPAAAAPGDSIGRSPATAGSRTYEITGYSKGFFPKGAEDVAIQPDGKILAVSELQDGNSHWWFGVHRWLPNGDLDRSFGSGGWVANDLGAFPMPHTVALQADGKILVGGQIECPGLQLCFGIVRYNPSGSIDGSFGVSGVARATFPGARCGCDLRDLAVQRNGRIVAVGWRLRGGDAQDDSSLQWPVSCRTAGSTGASRGTAGFRSTSATATTSARRSRCSRTAGSSSAAWRSIDTGRRTISWSCGFGRTERSTGRSPETASGA